VEEPEPTAEAPGKHRRRRPRVRLGAVIALAIGAGLAAWAVIGSRDTESSPSPGPVTTAKPLGPIALSASGLRTLTRTVDQPIYWAGPKAGFLYELTRTSAGKVYLRYLPPGVKVGSKQASYLIVATYPFHDPLQALENLTDGDLLDIPGGGGAMVDRTHPESVYLAYPDVDEQIEIFDPSPRRALEVAQSGDVRPVTP
jgi:hypothetical protein